MFADPRAKICFGSVFFEGIVIHGMFPYVALLLLMAGQTHSSYAGLVIAGFGLGGILFSLALPFLVVHVSERQLMLTGAACAAIAFMLIALNLVWYVQAAVFVLFGLGFYMLHNNIQVHVTELSQTARGTALSMHSSAFFTGQAIGPIYYGYAFGHFGTSVPLLIGAAVISRSGSFARVFCGTGGPVCTLPRGRKTPIIRYRPGVPRKARLRSNPSNLSGSFQRREPR